MPKSYCSFRIDAEQSKAAKVASTVRYKLVLSNESDPIDGIELRFSYATCPRSTVHSGVILQVILLRQPAAGSSDEVNLL